MQQNGCKYVHRSVSAARRINTGRPRGGTIPCCVKRLTLQWRGYESTVALYVQRSWGGGIERDRRPAAAAPARRMSVLDRDPDDYPSPDSVTRPMILFMAALAIHPRCFIGPSMTS
ncbi:hypothetical protein EVAR_99300_1 [Eumeta japonica]|uniref:Uncharacterized protein n=1 Tax=Eumeta variegata TaxID=151549 RepID=A0A4C1YUE1_EUMVA|nr:hypothetical protein EVAR_99300_1 [Eumeta japonica]